MESLLIMLTTMLIACTLALCYHATLKIMLAQLDQAYTSVLNFILYVQFMNTGYYQS